MWPPITRKKAAVLDAFEQEADALAASAFDIGHIGIGGALCYLDFRFADRGLAHGRIRASRAGTSNSARAPRCAPRSRWMTVSPFAVSVDIDLSSWIRRMVDTDAFRLEGRVRAGRAAAASQFEPGGR